MIKRKGYKQMDEKEYLHIRELFKIKGMTPAVCAKLTGRSQSLVSLIKRFPTMQDYKNYVHKYDKGEKTNGKVEQKPVWKSHDENYIIPLLIRIDKNLRELVTMKRESMALYHYKKAHNRWF